MRAPISVVIPTLNAETELASCLATLYEGVQAGLIRELIVVDGGSEDGTVHMAREAGAEVVLTKPSRGGQLKAGCAKARGEWLLVLHSDSVLEDGWTVPVGAHLAHHSTAYFKLRFDAEGIIPRIVAGWANLRARVLGMPFGDQGLLLRRVAYETAGGYPSIALMEDVALMRALPGRPVPLAATLITSAERYEAAGWLRRGARNISLQVRYLLGASPEVLAKAYRRK